MIDFYIACGLLVFVSVAIAIAIAWHDLQRKHFDKGMEEATNVIDELSSRLNEAVDLNLQLGRN